MKALYDAEWVPNYWCNFLHDWPRHAAPAFAPLKAIHRVAAHGVRVAPQQPMALLRQSTDASEAFVEIPASVHQEYTRYRPTPLRRATNFERLLGGKGKIFYKYEGGNVSGSHKLNSALAQAFYYKSAGITHLVTGTGAGQWGSALAYACSKFELKCTVFMVGVS
ncbi:MAG: pyridoxal-phosphate dependent enzyme, partial [Bryobacteraceae bacterium]